MTQSVDHDVVAAVDFGEASARAVTAAGVLAANLGATLSLLHAEPIDPPVYFTHEQIERLEREEQHRRDQCADWLTRFGRQHTNYPFSPVLDRRSAADAILAHAAPSTIVVMGTHGRRGPSRWWLGSVAERVLRRCSRPLMIVRATDAVDALFERVLVHAAAPAAGESTLAYANALAERSGGTTIDGRFRPIEDVVSEHHPTLLVAATPLPADAAWLTHVGEPLVRFSTVPTLFVPEPAGVDHPAMARAGRLGEHV